MKLSRNLALLLLFPASSALALDNNWTGVTSTDWNDGSNWSNPEGHVDGNHVPNNSAGHGPDEDAVVNVATGNFPIITADISAIPRDTKVGIGGGQTGRVDHRAGTYTSGAANWTFIGRDGGNGTYNLADTSGAGGTFTGFAQGSGNLNAGDRILVGSGANSRGVFNVNTSGIVNINVEFQVGGEAGSTATFNMDNGTLNNGNLFFIGNSGSVGNVNISGGTVSNGGELWVGQGAGSTGNLNISGGSVTAGNWIAVGRESSTGVVNLSGTGSLEMTGVVDANAQVTVGTGDGGNGTINISDSATLTTTKMILGENTPTSVGIVNQTGGMTIVSVNLDVQGAGTGTYNLSGGTLQATNIDGATGTFDITGTGRLQGVSVFTGNLTQAGGTVAPGMSPGTMTVTGNYSQQAGGTLEIEIDSASSYDILSVGGDVNLLGDLDIIAMAGLSTNDIFTIIDNTGVNPLTGLFANHAMSGEQFLEDGYLWQIDYGVGSDANDVTLTVLAIPEPSAVVMVSLGALLIFRRRRRA